MRILYRALLRLYPPTFRRRFEAELLAAFDDERGATRHQGGAGVVAGATPPAPTPGLAAPPAPPATGPADALTAQLDKYVA